MKTLRKLSSVLVLTLVLGLPAFAGQIETPPCAAPVPGQIETPPCQGTAPADTGGPSNGPSNSSTETAVDATFTEIATEVMERMLSIF